MNDAIDRFNARFEQVNSPEARQRRARERAEYEARYEAARTRKHVKTCPHCGTDAISNTGYCPYCSVYTNGPHS